MKNNYNTKQKSLILDYLMKKNAHATACEITAALKSSVSTATVYRQLQKLVDDGIVKKYVTGGSALYQYGGLNCSDHFHLKCTKCNTLYHVDCSFLSELSIHVLKHHSFCVDKHKTVMYGLCENCVGGSSNE